MKNKEIIALALLIMRDEIDAIIEEIAIQGEWDRAVPDVKVIKKIKKIKKVSKKRGNAPKRWSKEHRRKFQETMKKKFSERNKENVEKIPESIN